MAARNRQPVAATVGSTGLREVLANLPDSGALVGYARYDHLSASFEKPEPRYMALVLTPGVQPAVVPIGRADRIDRLVEAWRAEAGTDPRLDPGRRGETRYLEAGRLLRRAIWDPIAARLKDRRYAFIVPDGVINLVSFAALPMEMEKEKD